MRPFWKPLTLAALCAALPAALPGADRPNFVWILSEDNSKHYLRLFDEQGAPAPNIERLARDGIAFTHAFSNAPVCSVSRTTLMTSMLAPRGGFQYHRKAKLAQLPEGFRMFPSYLRQAGYYTTNNQKKDYNVVEGDGVWDESSGRATWRGRPSPEAPFFHMMSTGVSHEGQLHFSAAAMERDATRTSPEGVALAPYHPDTPTFRYTLARYHDRMGAVDEVVGRVVEQLEEDGLLEKTFLFYFGDHGGVLPRSKGYIYESGLHVPLVVRIPERWRELVKIPRGTRVEGFVSFIDFGPTVLHLAGVEVPALADGRPFLGPGVSLAAVNARDEAFGYADRFDEKYDLCRSLRKGRFKYLRNYQPFYPDGLRNNYRYRMLAYREWLELYRQGKLTSAQRPFFEAKTPEALYDLQVDPHEVHNLARDPAHAEKLAELRGRLRERVKGFPDLSFFPESYLVDHALDDPIGFGRKHAERIGRLVDVADLSLLAFEKARPQIERSLGASDPWERYWALIGSSSFAGEAKSLAPAAKERLRDEEPLVRVRAAEFLAIVGAADPRPTLYEVLNATRSPVEAALALNTAVFTNDHLSGYPFDVAQLRLQVGGDSVERRLEYLSP